MKKLMLGNEAVARGAYEAGVRVVSSYPGTPSTEITEFCAAYPEIDCEWAPNEKVAVETAFGAAMTGARAMSCMKHVGVNVAADPLYTAAYTGVNAGMVIVAADDPYMHSSQNEQDSRMIARAAHIPMLEPADSQECHDYIQRAFELSECYDTPVFLRLSTRLAHQRSPVEMGERAELPVREYKKDFMKYVMMPGMARKRHLVVEAREQRMEDEAASLGLNRVEMRGTALGVVCAGVVYQYVREALPEASILKLGLSYPMDRAAVRDFAVRAAAPERRADALMVIRFAGQGDNAVRFCQRQRLIMRSVDVPDVFVHAERNGDDAVMCRRDGHALCEQMHPLHRAEPFLPDGDFARIRLERAFAGEHAVGNIECEAVRCKPIGIFRQRHAFHGDIQRIRGIQRLFPALPLLMVDAREVDGGHLLYARFANRPANAHIPIARQEAVAVIRVLCRVKPRSLNHRIHPCIPPHVQNFPPCGIHGGKFAAALRFSCYGLQVFGCGNFGSAQFASWERPHPPTAAGTFPLGESEVG